MAVSEIDIARFRTNVIEALQANFPDELADKSFDNTGLILEAPWQPHVPNENLALLTIDLTQSVADEAIEKNASIVIAYHPIIFKPLKSLTLQDTQQRSLLRLASHGISVYCPHTAVDAAGQGNAWALASALGTYLHFTTVGWKSSPSFRISVIQPAAEADEFSITGMGRLLDLGFEVSFETALKAISSTLNLKHIPFALPQQCKTPKDFKVKSIAICVGSGWSIIKNANADLYLTGECSHHDTLAAIENGKGVISTFHSNSERFFLNAIQARLSISLVNRSRAEHGIPEDVLDDTWGRIEVSQADKEPYQIWQAPQVSQQ